MEENPVRSLKEKLRKQALYKRLKENPEFVAKEKVRLRKRSQEHTKLSSDMHHIFIPALREFLGLDPRYDIWSKVKE